VIGNRLQATCGIVGYRCDVERWNALFQLPEKCVTLSKQMFIDAGPADVCAAKQPAGLRKRPFEEGNGGLNVVRVRQQKWGRLTTAICYRADRGTSR